MIFIAGNIHAARVNLLMNDFSAGLPSPLAMLGLADAVMRDLGLTPWAAGVVPVLHHVDISRGRTRPEMENKFGVFKAIETPEDMIGSVRLSLILDLPGCDDESALADCLMRRRIAGGTIQNNRINVRAVTGNGSVFNLLGRGHAMVAPQQASHCQASNGSRESYDRVLELLFPDHVNAGPHYWIPAAVGYRLLEKPEEVPERTCRQTQYVPHVFAEPLLGLAELVSNRNWRLTTLSEEDFPLLFWKWRVERDLVLGHHAYQFNTGQQEIPHG